MNKRGSGILLHITSLPSPYGIGDMGSWAYKFVDFLAEAKQRYWQILPLNPTDPAFDNSPYHSLSALAYNPLLISPEFLVRDGLLTNENLNLVQKYPNGWVDFPSVIAYKTKLFEKAFATFKKKNNDREYEKFCIDNSSWLEDFSLFASLRNYFDKRVWSDWPVEIRDRQSKQILEMKKTLKDKIAMEKFLQYQCHKQWLSLKEYCNKKGIQIIGDIPIYVDFDSADVWTNPEIFKLDDKKRPYVVAGVPPDYFSETGQLWGNPVYRWEKMKEKGYEWWIKRISHNIELFDVVRIDHFRGLVAYWEVPATEKTAIKGEWIPVPARDFFDTLKRQLSSLPIIAEDLGFITQDVIDVINHYNLPGMKILLFSFGEGISINPYIPHNLMKNCILYTGTHDNNTVRGWLENEARPEDKARLKSYLGREISDLDMPWELIRLAMMSVANTAIVPMQDILGLGKKDRMNTPGTSNGNWRWQLTFDQLDFSLTGKLREMVEIYGRNN
jgi:4-alpha-glucanotransferase